MSFTPIKFLKYSKDVSIERSKIFCDLMKTRRSIRGLDKGQIKWKIITQLR